MVVHNKTHRPGRSKKKSYYSLTPLLAGFTGTHGTSILVTSGIIFIISLFGISRLVVENSFINYFKDTTEIYQGLKVIDQKLGGTTPLDVIIEIDEAETASRLPASEIEAKSGDEFDEFDEFDESESAEDDERYWFTADKMARITEIHDYLDSLPETGKVMSLATMLKIAEDLNNGQPLPNGGLNLLVPTKPTTSRDLAAPIS